MNSRLKEVLSGNEANCILPLVWQYGAQESVIRDEIEMIYKSGVRAVCLESKRHPGFMKTEWWRDFDIVMEVARRNAMQVWVLDDLFCPSGYANGALVDQYPALKRLFLHEYHIDAVGPQKNASFLTNAWLTTSRNPVPTSGASIIAAVAAKRAADRDDILGELIDLSASLTEDTLYWDIPDGNWRIFLMAVSPQGGCDSMKDFINPISRASVQQLIKYNYEPYYDRYSADFGITFAGFFSDEPGFYNDKDTYAFESKIGKHDVVLPWSLELSAALVAEFQADFRRLLPLLWHEQPGRSDMVRYSYMDKVTTLYAENFTDQLGAWCRKHQVQYIGHLLEDNGLHARLGSGTGHFFRAEWGQDMAGIDVVLDQLRPGLDAGPVAMNGTDADGEFYHYALGKLGSSLAHLDSKKQGRAMCEVFGAYGWHTGLKLMKWIYDHMLVRGINHFMPHAFSQAGLRYPDNSGSNYPVPFPPHMYAQGDNPQYRYYKVLYDYCNRLSHLLSHGRHIAPLAVLYHAEAEWSGRSMPCQQPMRVMMQNLMDCDIVSCDLLCCDASVEQSILKINNESFRALVIPFSEALPLKLLTKMLSMANVGLPIIFIDAPVVRTSDSHDSGEVLAQLFVCPTVSVVKLAALAETLNAMGMAEIKIDHPHASLRYLHIQHDDSDVFMFFNEHPYDRIEREVSIPASAGFCRYDAFSNQLSRLDGAVENGSFKFKLSIQAYESILVVADKDVMSCRSDSPCLPAEPVKELCGNWKVALATAREYPRFTTWKELTVLVDLSRKDLLPSFSGTIRYELEFTLESVPDLASLDLGEVYETAELWLNGTPMGVKICPPYVYKLNRQVLKQGKNTLVAEITNTLVKAQKDYFSRVSQQEPSGLLGPVCLICS